MITGAIFDMDGVLLDSLPVWEEADTLYLREQGKEPEPGLSETLFTMTMTEAAKYLRTVYDIPKSDEEIVEDIVATIRHYYEAKIPAKKGALSFMRELRNRGIPVTVATSSDRVLAEAGLGRLGMLEYVEGIFTCSEAGASKDKSPAVYLAARERMGTEIDKTWVFEDGLHGIVTAGRAGFPTVGIYDALSESNQEAIRGRATIYLEDLTDFERFYQLAER